MRSIRLIWMIVMGLSVVCCNSEGGETHFQHNDDTTEAQRLDVCNIALAWRLGCQSTGAQAQNPSVDANALLEQCSTNQVWLNLRASALDAYKNCYLNELGCDQQETFCYDSTIKTAVNQITDDATYKLYRDCRDRLKLFGKSGSNACAFTAALGSSSRIAVRNACLAFNVATHYETFDACLKTMESACKDRYCGQEAAPSASDAK